MIPAGPRVARSGTEPGLQSTVAAFGRRTGRKEAAHVGHLRPAPPLSAICGRFRRDLAEWGLPRPGIERAVWRTLAACSIHAPLESSSDPRSQSCCSSPAGPPATSHAAPPPGLAVAIPVPTTLGFTSGSSRSWIIRALRIRWSRSAFSRPSTGSWKEESSGNRQYRCLNLCRLACARRAPTDLSPLRCS